MARIVFIPPYSGRKHATASRQILERKCSERGGRRTARQADRDQGAFRKREKWNGAAEIIELSGGDSALRVRIRADQVCRARHAVLRRLEVADEVVMLERARQQDEHVDSDADEVQRTGTALR